MKNDEKKFSMSNLIHRASDVGKKTVENIQNGAKAIAEKNKANNLNKKIEKYNPLFPNDYKCTDFKIPNVIAIVDDAVRRDIDVCEGAIGWREKVNDVEILYLYDEWIEESKLQFIPVAKCDDVYCVDPFDRTKFIKSEYIFKKTNDDKLAELKNVAYCLGAKSCSIEILDEERDSMSLASAIKTRISGADFANNESNAHKQSSKVVAYFDGNNEPKRPELKWFAYDDNIKNLVEMRCSQKNSIRIETLEISESSISTMSQRVACAIDKIKNISGNASLERQSVREQNRKLIFEIEF